MGPFLSSFGYACIILAVNYVFKWIEANTTRTKNAKFVVEFVKTLFFFFSGVECLKPSSMAERCIFAIKWWKHSSSVIISFTKLLLATIPK